MNSTRWMSRTLCGPALLLLAGCVSPAPYGGAYPNYYGSPSPGYAAPPGASPSPVYPSPQMGPGGGPGSSAPSWTPTPATPPSNPNNRTPTFIPPGKKSDQLVPEPLEGNPGPLSPPANPRPNSQNTPFGSDGPTEPFDRGNDGAQLTPPPRGEVQLTPVPRAEAPVQSFAAVEAEPFQPPLEREGRPGSPDLLPTGAKTAAKPGADNPNPYAYDRGSYSWLRGVVDYDARDHSWQIIYSPRPEAGDRFGGALRLADHPKLKDLHDGDFVYIEGHLNPQRPDGRGKPQYEVEGEQIARLRYTGKQSVGN